MNLRSLAAVPFTFLLACSTVSAGAPTGDGNRASRAQHAAAVAAPATGHSAGDVDGTAVAHMGAAEIAALRAEGPAALERLLLAYDRMHAESVRDQMAATIDKVAGQRYATVSRLYWYEDLEAAKAVAKATGKPILSLRMLGRLDEDLSCANSRFFRTTLYPDAAVSTLLRERFVLHWSSERNAPRVTVDFGDGRKLESTVTGNSAHYVLDGDGRPIDVLPGLYAPQVFIRELTTAATLHASIRGKTGSERDQALIAHHQAAMEALNQRWASLPAIPVIEGSRMLLTGATVTRAAALAQRATMSKAYVEVPMLKTVDVGADPGALPADLELWAEIGQRLLEVGAPPEAAAAEAALANRWGLEARAVKPKPGKAAPAAAARPILDDRARALVDSMLAVPAGGSRLDDAARAAVIAQLEQTIVADTALNEVRLRPLIRGYLVSALMGGDASFATVNSWIYTNAFHAPSTDVWMGLLPRDTFTGLPGGAVTGGA